MIVSLNQAKDLLLQGDVVAVPTETVYGLAASITCPDAIEAIYAMKRRPKKNPMIIHVANMNQAQKLTDPFCPETRGLIETFWPGPLTLILPVNKSEVPASVRAGLDTIALRMPSHPDLCSLIEETGPLAAPSANLSGTPSATRPAHVEDDFGMDFPILGGETLGRGIESTIIGKLSDWKLLRPGAIPLEEIEKALGRTIALSNERICPGTMFRHYSPHAHLILNSTIPEDCDAIVGYEGRSYSEHYPLYNLGTFYKPQEIAANLFDVLRQLDRDGVKKAWLDLDIPSHGLYLSIKERLLKAASQEGAR